MRLMGGILHLIPDIFLDSFLNDGFNLFFFFKILFLCCDMHLMFFMHLLFQQLKNKEKLFGFLVTLFVKISFRFLSILLTASFSSALYSSWIIIFSNSASLFFLLKTVRKIDQEKTIQYLQVS